MTADSGAVAAGMWSIDAASICGRHADETLGMSSKAAAGYL
jgi:hypothetical protein